MNSKKYRCRECGKETVVPETQKEAPECCGEPMEFLEVCREAPSAEHARPFNEDEPCDDDRSGKRV